MIRFWYLILFLPLVTYSQVRFERFNSQNGLSQNTIRAITQDHHGFLWIATSDGLNRYDGLNFRVYQPDMENPTTSLPSNLIHTLLRDSKNRLWVATRNGLRLYNSENDTFVKYAADSTADNLAIDYLYEDADGIIWLLPYYDKKILKLDLKKSPKFQVIEPAVLAKFTRETTFNSILQIHQDRADRNMLWIATNEFRILQYDKERNRVIQEIKIDPPDDPANDDIFIEEDEKGNLWLATDWGIRIVDKKTYQVRTLSIAHSPALSSQESHFIIRSQKQNVMWIGMLDGLLRIEDENNYTVFRHQPLDLSSISGNEIRSIFEDDAGIVWIGTDHEGLSKYDPEKIKFKHYQHIENTNSLSHNNIRTFAEDSFGFIWIATVDGGLNRFDPQSQIFTKYDTENEPRLPENRITDLKKDRTGNLWASCFNQGLVKIEFDAQKKPIFKSFPKLPYQSIQGLMVDSEGIIWLGTRNMGLVRFDPTTQIAKSYPIENQANVFVTELLEANDGRIWLGTPKGLSLFDKKTEKFIHFKPSSVKGSISSGNIQSIVIDSKKRTWIGTWGGGINLFDEKTQTFQYFTEKDGLPNNVVYGILEDEAGKLWLSTNKGICQFDPVHLRSRNFRIEDGLQGNEFNRKAFFKSSTTQKMYLGGVNGFNEFVPSAVKESQYQPIVVFTDFKLFNRTVRVNDSTQILQKCIWENAPLVISPEQQVFTVDFVALHYSSPQKNKYAYRLLGFSREWIETDAQHASATFTNLPAGNYTLVVRGTNSDGLWSKHEAKMDITVLPPFYETWWFRTLLSLGLIALLVGGYKWRTYNLKLQNQKLEQEVLIRTQKIESQHVEILQQNEELIQNHEEMSSQKDLLEQKNNLLETYTTKIQQSIRAAYTIQSAILPSDSQMELLFGDFFVLNRPKDVVSGDFYWAKKFQEQKYLVVADCTGHGVSGALMTMIGSVLLDRIVGVLSVREPAQILSTLHAEIQEILRQKQTQNRDGMDIAIIDLTPTHIHFSGAKRPLYIGQKGKIEKIAPVRKSIGGYRQDALHFEQISIERQPNMTLYMCSDGYADQNDRERRSFSEKKMMEVLQDIGHRPLVEQKVLLDATLEEHMTATEQRDDILVVGIRL